MTFDLSLDVELKSEDGVIVKVKAYHLVSASAFFRDLFNSQSPGKDAVNPATTKSAASSRVSTSPRQIDMPAQSVIVKLFVALIAMGTLDNPASILDSLPTKGGENYSRYDYVYDPYSLSPVNAITSILALLDHFDCAVILRHRAVLHFEEYFKNDLWALFCIAATEDFVYLAQRVIRLIYYDAGSEHLAKLDPSAISLKVAQGIPFPWFLGYLRAYSAATEKYHLSNATKTTAIQKDNSLAFWSEVATSFRPVLQ